MCFAARLLQGGAGGRWTLSQLRERASLCARAIPSSASLLLLDWQVGGSPGHSWDRALQLVIMHPVLRQLRIPLKPIKSQTSKPSCALTCCLSGYIR